MERILIAGVETVVGSNLAASLSEQYHIVGLSFSVPIGIDGCETAVCPSQDAESIRKWVAAVRPGLVVHCGLSDATSWQRARAHRVGGPSAGPYVDWARCARQLDSHFTLISSDAVFTGPWMFHKEESRCYCESAEAAAIRYVEDAVRGVSRDLLLVRTCAYGWTPQQSGPGWIEDAIERLQVRAAGAHDLQHHATPILASDLADMLRRAWEAGLSGVYHIAGAERVSPMRFAEMLSERFDLPRPARMQTISLEERARGFGQGETSLHSAKIRKILDIPMPLLGDGLCRLREQAHNGYCERLDARVQTLHEKVA